MKKILVLLVLTFMIFSLTACKKENKKYGLEFKSEYESLNGQKNKGEQNIEKYL